MPIPQQKYREIIFLTLFTELTGKTQEKETIELVMELLQTSKSNVLKAKEEAALILQKLPEIDGVIAKFATEYDFDRIQTVEKTALRLGAYELLQKEIPPKVAIAEALRLTKKFSTPSAVAFVNAILDKFYATLGK